MKPDVKMACIKCGHIVYVRKEKFIKDVSKYSDIECPNCGEERDEGLWMLIGEGDYNADLKAGVFIPLENDDVS